jgi:hypothetical protein
MESCGCIVALFILVPLLLLAVVTIVGWAPTATD